MDGVGTAESGSGNLRKTEIFDLAGSVCRHEELVSANERKSVDIHT